MKTCDKQRNASGRVEDLLQSAESRYRTLFEFSEVSILDVDFSRVYLQLHQYREQGVKDLRRYMQENGGLDRRILDLIRIEHVNDATLRLFEAENEDSFLAQVDKTIAPGTMDVFAESLCALWDGQEVFRSQTVFLTLSGRQIHTMVSYRLPRGELECRHVAITLVDISEQKKAEKALIDNQALLSEAQTMAGIGSWEMDPQTRKAVWCKEVFQIFEIEPRADVGPDFLAGILHPDDRECVLTSLNEAVTQGTRHHMEYRIIRPGGEERWIECRALQKWDDNGDLVKLRGVIQDITDSKNIQQKLIALKEKSQHSENKFRAITEQATEGITVADAEGNYIFVNAAFCNMLGYSEQELLQMTVFDVKAPQQDHGSFERTKGSEQGQAIRVELQRKNGSIFTAEIIGTMIEFDGQTRVLGTIRDISDRIQAEKALIESEQRFDLAMEVANDGIWDWRLSDNSVHFDARYFTMAGYQPGAFASNYEEWRKRIHENDVSRVEQSVQRYLSGKASHYDIEFRFLREDGEFMWMRSRGKVVEWNESGDPLRFVGTHSDISLLKEHERQILHQAHYDPLTDLPNRFLTMDRLSQLVNEAERNNSKVAVLFLDLDDFKKINDSLGHEIGDRLLIETADRLRLVVRHHDTVGRLGGDEFIILLEGITAASDALPVAENILNRLRKSFRIEARELILSGSLGIAIYPQDGQTPSDLLRNADSAMYHAKQLGRNTCSFFTEAMNREVSRRLEIEEQIHGALGRGEFSVYYQPKMDVRNQTVIGAEALLRWDNPALGKVSPREFIPIAEQTGLIIPIGQFMLSQALTSTARWQKYLPGFKIAVNLSPTQFRDPGLVNSISKTLSHTAVISECLEFEITEGVLMSGHDYIEQALSELKSLGVMIAMDDFGTGYSSLAYLRKFPFDVLKIDRSFVRDISSDPADRELINATVAMAHGMHLKVVAEGVESEQQFEYLKKLGCDYAQGYLFGKPMSSEAMTAMLERQPGRAHAPVAS